MSISDDIKERAEYTEQLSNAFEHIGIVKHMWLERFGEQEEHIVDDIIKEASDRADDIVNMSKEDYKDFIREKTVELAKDIALRADAIGIFDDDDEEEEFENERSENGDFKGRVS